MSGLRPGTYRILVDRDGWAEWAPGRVTDPAKAVGYRVSAGRTAGADSIVTAPGFIAGWVLTSTGEAAPNIKAPWTT